MPKRKLDTNDIPVTETGSTAEPKHTSFDSFGLEPRIVRGVRDQRWGSPTKVQQLGIPPAMEGKDVFMRSSTGSGKTGAYLLPILSSIVRNRRGTSALILCPSRELCLQHTKVIKGLTAHCGQDVRVQNIASKEADVVLRSKLADSPEIVVATPGRASAMLDNGSLSLEKLAHLVIDECDMVLAMGYMKDMENVKKRLPNGVQVFLSSATLSTDTEAVQGLFCRDPVILNLDDPERGSLIKQYVIKCAEEEKFLLIYALFILKLIKGKTIVFVGDIDRSYRVKLFLDQFSIRSCVLNSELPLGSRLHIVEEFNRNIFDILIASSEGDEVLGTRQKENTKDDTKPPRKKSRTNEGKHDSGVSRGVDFLNVSTVVNFDLPSSYKSYFHRIGRTARAGKSGTSITFVVPKDEYRKHKSTSFLGSAGDEDVLRKIERHLEKEGQKMEDYKLDMSKLDAFRYRFADALRAVTRIAVREARIKELRTELLQSEKLSRYFEENPTVAQQLRHDTNLNHPARVQQHLKHVPDYLLPGGKKAEDIGFVSLDKEKRDRHKIIKRKGRAVRGRNGRIDPLKTFNKRGRGKK